MNNLGLDRVLLNARKIVHVFEQTEKTNTTNINK